MYTPNDKWVVFCSDDAKPHYIHANNGGDVILGGRVDAKLWWHTPGRCPRLRFREESPTGSVSPSGRQDNGNPGGGGSVSGHDSSCEIDHTTGRARTADHQIYGLKEDTSAPESDPQAISRYRSCGD